MIRDSFDAIFNFIPIMSKNISLIFSEWGPMLPYWVVLTVLMGILVQNFDQQFTFITSWAIPFEPWEFSFLFRICYSSNIEQQFANILSTDSQYQIFDSTWFTSFLSYERQITIITDDGKLKISNLICCHHKCTCAV